MYIKPHLGPGVLMAWAALCNPCAGQDKPDGNISAKPSLAARGTCTMFMKRLEIMDRNSYGRDSRPLAPKHAVRNLLRYDAIGMASLLSAHNRPAWRTLRREHPKILTFYYLSGVSARTEAAGLTYFNYNEILPEWYLLDTTRDATRANPAIPSNRIRWSTSKPQSPNYNRFYFDVANPDFQRWAARRIVEHVAGRSQGLEYPYDGLLMDNVAVGSRRMQRIDHYHQGWKYSGNHESWNEGFFAYLNRVHSALSQEGYLLIANHTLDYGSDVDDNYWREFLPCVDGAMTEQALGYGSERNTGEAWVRSMARHEDVIKQGVIDWWVWYPPSTEAEGRQDFLYGYCSWLLIREPGLSLFQASRGDPGYANPQPPWYEEYELPIGLPTSGRRRLGECWARDYGRARVVVNPTRTEQSVAFKDGIHRVDWTTKQTGNRFTVPRASGRILLPVP